ncbi:EthD domain-containing protein [Sphingobium nicotianae]|uniref:EthD family reductase n=1 Tax=Sphingobium nicotianae TaxID=2782607 RepID=A0A9X1DD34_9SPHN|nr:EthD domain-containing protein [Sphingobium nicotianae]MBT2187793.1 EthD family reductase [Sphingobium nicotianae]
MDAMDEGLSNLGSHLGATRRDLMAAIAALPAALALPGALRAATTPLPASIKLLSIVARREALSQDKFRQHWLGIHGPMAREVPGLNGFILSEAVGDSAAPAPGANYASRFDGIAHIWYPSRDAMRDGMATPGSRAWIADGDLFIDRAASRGYFVSEQVVVPPPRGEGGLKHTALLVRKAGTTHEQFMAHWAGRHAELARGVPGLVGCVFNHIETGMGAQNPWAEIDGIAEIWWDSGAVNMGGRVDSPQATAWLADGDLFIDRARSRNIVSLEHAMIDPPAVHG